MSAIVVSVDGTRLDSATVDRIASVATKYRDLYSEAIFDSSKDSPKVARNFKYNFLSHAIDAATKNRNDDMSAIYDGFSADKIFDSVDVTANGPNFAERYTKLFQQVLEAPTYTTPLLDPSFFEVDNTVLSEDETFTQDREIGSARAQIYTGTPLTENMAMYNYETFRGSVVPVVSSVTGNIVLERRSERRRMSDLNTKTKRAVHAIRRTMADLIKNGSDNHQVYGLKNHQFMTKIVTTTNWDDTTTDTTDILSSFLHMLTANFDADTNYLGNVTRILMASKPYMYAARTVHNDGAKDRSLLMALKEQAPNIDNISFDAGLNDFFGTNRHAAVFFMPSALKAVIPEDIVVLPFERSGLDLRIAMLAFCGGTVLTSEMDAYIVEIPSTYTG